MWLEHPRRPLPSTLNQLQKRLLDSGALYPSHLWLKLVESSSNHPWQMPGVLMDTYIRAIQIRIVHGLTDQIIARKILPNGELIGRQTHHRINYLSSWFYECCWRRRGDGRQYYWTVGGQGHTDHLSVSGVNIFGHYDLQLDSREWLCLLKR